MRSHVPRAVDSKDEGEYHAALRLALAYGKVDRGYAAQPASDAKCRGLVELGCLPIELIDTLLHTRTACCNWATLWQVLGSASASRARSTSVPMKLPTDARRMASF